ncbi:MAG: dihydrolipoamide acetyltransferase family protein [Gemmatimonadota bacterium]
MATKVVMAQLSPTMEEGKLLEWKVEEGAEIAQGDILAEIETDKANMDVEALGSGVLRKILVSAGRTVPVGAIIGVIAAPDEDISAILAQAEAEAAAAAPPEAGLAAVSAGSGAEGAPAAPTGGAGVASGAAEPPPPEPRAAEAPAPGTEAREDGRAKASPLARKMAREEGLRISDITGSGPAGRIIKRDIEAALAGRTAAPARLVEQTIGLSQMRKAIARRLTQSIGPVPTFYLTTEIDMERALELRADMNARLESGKIGVNHLLIKVAAEALVRHPEINASWTGEAIRRHGSADIGIAVAIEDGLITPVLRLADRKGLLAISVEARDLIERARARRLSPEEYQGATFTISNLGMFEIDQFTAIINPPEAAILAVGRTEEKPVVVDGQIAVRRRMRVTLSCDHRVIDGATGARFLDTFKVMLENPLELVL